MTNPSSNPRELDATAGLDRVQDIIELEVFLFGGVPELPEPVYERDYHTYHEVRTTRNPIPPVRHRGAGGAPSLGYIEIDLDSDEMTFSEFVPPPGDTP